MSSLVHWVAQPPTLRQPLLVVALDGFIDAGNVASTAVMFLQRRLQATLVATLDRDSFVDYRARRPDVVVDNGRLVRVDWPEIELFVATIEGGERDLVLLVGPEPDAAWTKFFDTVHSVIKKLGITEVVGIGAYPAAAPHTRPIRMRKASAGEGVSDLAPAAIAVPGYHGPIGAATALQVHLAELDVPSLGLWAEVPHYIAATPNPAGTLAMVTALAAAVGATFDTAELEAAANMHQQQVSEAIAEQPEAVSMVAALERAVDDGTNITEMPSGDDIADEIESYLRTQTD